MRFGPRALAATVALVLAAALCACSPATSDTSSPQPVLQRGRVVSVTDGDTARIRLDGGPVEKVRFIGIDAPEYTKTKEPFGKDATEYARQELSGKNVWLEYDVERRDRYGRLLAYVWLGQPSEFDSAGRASDAEMRTFSYNARLALAGLAQQMTVPPNVKYADRFKQYVAEARAANRGLWATDAPP